MRYIRNGNFQIISIVCSTNRYRIIKIFRRIPINCNCNNICKIPSILFFLFLNCLWNITNFRHYFFRKLWLNIMIKKYRKNIHTWIIFISNLLHNFNSHNFSIADNITNYFHSINWSKRIIL